MKFLFLGDIMGRSGRDLALDKLPELRERLRPDFVVVNGENAAGGFGITGKICAALYEAGADVITSGNHVWDQKETFSYIDGDPKLLRPINYPAGTPGRGSNLYRTGTGKKVLVINAMGRVFMEDLDDPFAAVDRELARYPLGGAADFIFLDFHGEATSEKTAMGHFADGRASFVVGTHSHVPTADAHILPGGTAYQTDAGMCGDYDSVIGMEKDEPLRRFTRKIPGRRFAPAMGEATLCGTYVETGDNGLASHIAPLRMGGHLAPAWPV